MTQLALKILFPRNGQESDYCPLKNVSFLMSKGKTTKLFCDCPFSVSVPKVKQTVFLPMNAPGHHNSEVFNSLTTSDENS